MRRWRSDDRAPFAALNADEQVMRYFPSTLTYEQSCAAIDRIEANFQRHGFGLWAIEVDGEFAGFTGLNVTDFETPMGQHVEIGWRLARWAWGRGYASEAANAALRVGFDECSLDEIFSFTTTTNEPSIAVMRRVGMRRREDLDFDHPRTPGWWGARHVVYAIAAGQWRAETGRSIE